MKIIIVTIIGGSICLGLYLLDKACLWLEKKGLLYYRLQKPEGGFVSSALLEVQALWNPSTHHIIEMKQNKAKLEENEAGVPGDLKLPKA